ncbi:hypothetical protein JZ751_021454 [Albula glossodonta]|uniref:Globoside alpha-1,3-N-acetylgalactosaminyltransferase 1 n=1 Tax=Albula glossodonta TaxID=121402 RepID=A0A8T2NRU3_9TELE|nr:hypothetical protein JZ751_021454 [Albula glossodonta]
MTVTPWLAPIVWEGAFDPVIIDNMYKPLDLTIATTVFATAEYHYMSGLKVHYYIFTDQPKDVDLLLTEVRFAAGRVATVIPVPKYKRWQEISLRRMETIQKTIEEQIGQEADYIYCLDVDMKFHYRWGPEVLGSLVAAIHPWYYYFPREKFSYERRPASRAYIPEDQGDFYYMAAVFGGTIKEVHTLTKKCSENLNLDKGQGLEAIWQEESHLNWYLLHHKPTKLLSPEYLWDDLKRGQPREIQHVRFSAVIKNKMEVRENDLQEVVKLVRLSSLLRADLNLAISSRALQIFLFHADSTRPVDCAPREGFLHNSMPKSPVFCSLKVREAGPAQSRLVSVLSLNSGVNLVLKNGH